MCLWHIFYNQINIKSSITNSLVTLVDKTFFYSGPVCTFYASKIQEWTIGTVPPRQVTRGMVPLAPPPKSEHTATPARPWHLAHLPPLISRSVQLRYVADEQSTIAIRGPIRDREEVVLSYRPMLDCCQKGGLTFVLVQYIFFACFVIGFWFDWRISVFFDFYKKELVSLKTLYIHIIGVDEFDSVLYDFDVDNLNFKCL